MKNKKSIKNYMALLIMFYLLPFAGFAQFTVLSSVSFNALNDIYIAPAPVEQPVILAPALSIDPSILQPATSDQTAILSTGTLDPSVLQPATSDQTAILSTGTLASVGVAVYPYYLNLNYSVPYYVYFDWKHLNFTAANILSNSASAARWDSPSLSFLAYTGFNSYSENYSKQKLEFRIGLRTVAPYTGDFPPVSQNDNPIIKTLIFSGY